VTASVWRLALVALLTGLAVINTPGIYAQLVAAHVGERSAATLAIEMQNAAVTARIEVAAQISPSSGRSAPPEATRRA